MATEPLFRLLRSDDLLALDIEGVNLRLERGAGGGQLVPTGNPALLIVRFPPQQIAEETFSAGISNQRARALLAGTSQLVFRVAVPLPFTLESLLDWNRPELMLVAPSPGSPADQDTTAIEFPYRLLLAPDPNTRWRHKISPLLTNDRDGGRWAELWRTELAADPAERRVWAIGARKPGEPDPFGFAVDTINRPLIAEQSRAQTTLLGVPDIPVDRLTLSTLGASIDLRASWATGTLAGWTQNSTFGRDVLSRIEVRGFLYPTGHRATVTAITERSFSDIDGAAYLVKRIFIRVTEFERSYDEFNLPFRRIEIAAGDFPPLDNDIEHGGWPLINGKPLLFPLTGVDQSGNRSDFALPLGFVPAAQGASTNFDIGRFYAAAQLGGQRVTLAPVKTGGDQSTTLAMQSITFVDQAVQRDPDSFEPPFRPKFDTAMVDIPAVKQLFGEQNPVKIKLPDIFQRVGIDSAENKARLFAEFVDGAIPVKPSAQQLGGFLSPDLNFAGLSRELGPISGAADLPPVEALAGIAKGNFDPVAFLGDQAKLFGVISIADLFPSLSFTTAEQPTPNSDQIDTGKALDAFNASGVAGLQAFLEGAEGGPRKFVKTPVLSTRKLTDAVGLPTGIETTFLWKPKLKPPPGNIILLNLDDPSRPVSQFWMVSRMAAQAGKDPDYTVAGHFTEFDLSLLKVLTVKFRRLRFQAERGKSIELKPDISDITFDGPLRFVNDVQKALEAIGIDLPFGLDISPTRIIASYTLPLPSLSIGIFALENIRLSSALTLPLVPEAGPVRIRFALSERSDPFLVTVSLFAGGGFFALEIATDGSFTVEAAIEFGGRFAISLVVASGSVYLLGGFYFSIGNGKVKLEGYLRCGGSVEILGIITVSVEFYIGLGYAGGDNPPRNVLYGTASVRVCIEVLFISECVSFTVEKEFEGPALASDRERHDITDRDLDRFPAQPALAFADRSSFLFDRERNADEWDLVNRDEWASYCAAFA